MMLVSISDKSGMITLRFFHFANKQKEALSRGTKVQCFGEVRVGSNSREMVHPEYKIISMDQKLILADSLTPIYPTTKGLQQRSIFRLVGEALSMIKGVDDLIPPSISKK